MGWLLVAKLKISKKGSSPRVYTLLKAQSHKELLSLTCVAPSLVAADVAKIIIGPNRAHC